MGTSVISRVLALWRAGDRVGDSILGVAKPYGIRSQEAGFTPPDAFLGNILDVEAIFLFQIVVQINQR
jgi:hypothetical protein